MSKELITNGPNEPENQVPEEVVMSNDVQQEFSKEELDFEILRETVKSVRKKRVLSEEEKITETELESIPGHIEYLNSLIRRAADAGLDTFRYRCHNLSKPLTHAIAQTFREKYPRGFMVIVEGAAQQITIDWTGKNDC